MPMSEFSGLASDDRDTMLGHQLYKAECCDTCGVHPSEWKPDLGGDLNAVVAVWKYCRVCELLEAAKKAGPPTDDGGWHLTLKHNHH